MSFKGPVAGSQVGTAYRRRGIITYVIVYRTQYRTCTVYGNSMNVEGCVKMGIIGKEEYSMTACSRELFKKMDSECPWDQGGIISNAGLRRVDFARAS